MTVALVSGKTQELVGARPANAGTARPLILVAEDHEDTRFLLKCLEARDAGCDDYLIKPFAIGRMERALARHLSISLSDAVKL